MAHALKCCYDTFSDCSKHCSKCPNCYSITLSKIRDLLYSVDIAVEDYTCSFLSKAHYGYSLCSKLTYTQFSNLINYKNSLYRHYLYLLNGVEPCLCPEDIQMLYENTLTLVDISCCKSERSDIIQDKSNYDNWAINNPYCIAYEEWERLFLKMCPIIKNIEVKQVENPCLLLYTLSVIDKTHETCIIEVFDKDLNKPVNIHSGVKVLPVNCEIKVNGTVKTHECKLEYETLVKEYKCDITFKTYIKLLECNLTFNTISKLLKCGIKVDYNVTKKTCDLIINPTTTIPLCDVNLNELIEI